MASPIPTYFRPTGGIFKFEITINEIYQLIALPLDHNEAGPIIFNATINWGDGSEEDIILTNEEGQWITRDDSHYYYIPGNYIITITGICELFSCSRWYGVPLPITKILQCSGYVGFKVLDFANQTDLSQIVSLGSCGEQLTSASYMFHYTSIRRIPEDLFKYCPLIADFSNCFNHCSLVTSIPENLFTYNLNVTTFENTFYSCGYEEFVGSHLTGPAPTLWLRTPEPEGQYCFVHCEGLSNWDDIPDDWKTDI